MEHADNFVAENAHRMGTNLNLNPESNFVAGVSPQYWAYTPMSVMDVLNLKLKDGINWLQPGLSNSELSTPVSKCLLVGHIVYAAERRGGSMVYILDDGTGLIDCVHWSNNNDNNTPDPYHLPSLTDPIDHQHHRGSFAVGEPVRVFGKIDCLASTPHTTMATYQGTPKKGNDDTSNNTKFVVREIQVRIMERVEDYLVSEAHHWIDSCRLNPVSLHSRLDSLGPQIRSQIQNRINLPATDDKSSSWRVFGTNCGCNLPYMEDLLYCHCQCKAEPLDPFYRFRDALLRWLLSKQSAITKRLEFKYKEIRNDPHLQAAALKEIFADKTIEKNELVDKLFLKTFRALRSDGIIYLLNSNTDNYVLITRKEVLEPFIKSRIGNNIESNFVSYERAPRFISRVHNERLLYIKRLLLVERKGKNVTNS